MITGKQGSQMKDMTSVQTVPSLPALWPDTDAAVTSIISEDILVYNNHFDVICSIQNLLLIPDNTILLPIKAYVCYS